MFVLIMYFAPSVYCQSFCGHYIKIFQPIRFSDFERGIEFNPNSSFTFYYKSDSIIDSATGTYYKKHKHVFLNYSTPDYYSIIYDTIERKLDFKPPIAIKMIEPRKIKNPDSNYWPTELLIVKGKLRIVKYKNYKSEFIIEFRKGTDQDWQLIINDD